MLKIRRTTDRAAIVLTISGRLDAGNVGELRASLNAIPPGSLVVLELADLILADRDAVRVLKEYEAGEGVLLRNCPEYIRIWMAVEDV